MENNFSRGMQNAKKNFLGTCSHSKCPIIYKEALKKDILAYPCDTWLNFINGKCKPWEDKAILIGEKCPRT